jgi:hypothetical protein
MGLPFLGTGLSFGQGSCFLGLFFIGGEAANIKPVIRRIGTKLAPNQIYSVAECPVNPLAYAFSGSNPLLPTVFAKRKVVARELDENLFDYPRGALVLGAAKM